MSQSGPASEQVSERETKRAEFLLITQTQIELVCRICAYISRHECLPILYRLSRQTRSVIGLGMSNEHTDKRASIFTDLPGKGSATTGRNFQPRLLCEQHTRTKPAKAAAQTNTHKSTHKRALFSVSSLSLFVAKEKARAKASCEELVKQPKSAECVSSACGLIVGSIQRVQR